MQIIDFFDSASRWTPVDGRTRASIKVPNMKLISFSLIIYIVVWKFEKSNKISWCTKVFALKKGSNKKDLIVCDLQLEKSSN